MGSFDIIIIGGGMVGQAFALSMAKHNISIAIIEPNNPNPKIEQTFHTRVSAITPASERLLKTIGVWSLIKRKQAFTNTSVWDQNSHGDIYFSATDDKKTHLGHIIENDCIQSAMHAALSDTQVEFINNKLADINKTEQGYQVILDNGKQFECSLLIGADGACSRTRDLAGIAFSEHDYQQKAIVCNVRATQSFKKTTWQRFLSSSIIALLPLCDNQASIVWSAENHLADELLALPVQDFAKQLSMGVEGRFGQFEILSKIQAFPLIERSAKDYVEKNLALIGDAAHNIHPLAGQGVNLGFADVRELSQQLATNIDTLGHYLILRKYARARRLNNELMAKTMRGLNWIYKENNEPFRWARGFGMNLVNKNPKLKSFFQGHATGAY